MSTFKRTMCMLLSLVMVLGMFPVSAFATAEGLELLPAEPTAIDVLPEIPVVPEIPAVPEIIPEPLPELPAVSETPDVPEVPVEPEVLPTEEPVITPEPTVAPTEEPLVSPEPTETPAPAVEPVAVYFNCSPAELTIYVYDAYAVPVVAEADGGYMLMPGDYTYSAYAEGYLGLDAVPFTVIDGSGSLSIDVMLEAISFEGAAPEVEEPAEDEGADAEADGEGVEFVLLEGPSAEELGIDAELLYEYYLNGLFFGQIMPFGVLARDRLNDTEKYIYDQLKPALNRITSGTQSSTEVSLSLSGTGYSVNNANYGLILDAIYHDCPYEFFWYYGASYGYYSNNDLTFWFYPSPYYRPSSYNDDSPTIDTVKLQRATTAANTAAAIVSEYAALSDYDKLCAYADKICSLVEYDYDAANNNTFSLDVSPWSLVNVFDGDSSTNVVCEGYSEAFQYLCDNSTFTNDIEVYCATGNNHKWNIVRINGVSYLMDVTHCDDGNCAYRGPKFLAGAEGSIASGYYIYDYYTGPFNYVYYPDTIDLWGDGEDSILKLSETDLDPDSLVESDSEPIYGTFNGSPAWVDSNGNLLINEDNFPSANFRQEISISYDTESLGYLSEEQVAAVSKMYCAELAINSLKGIEYFTALEELYCAYNQLSSLDLSKNTKLKVLSCSNTPLSGASLKLNTGLTTLFCSQCPLGSLDLSACSSLEFLQCYETGLTSLDLSRNTALKSLDCSRNAIMTLELSRNTALTGLDCNNQNIAGEAYWEDGELKCDLRSLLGADAMSRVISVISGSFDSASGTVTLDAPAEGAEYAYFNYIYNTGAPFENAGMTVIVAVEVPEKPAVESYTVSYDANGGSGAPGVQKKLKDEPLPLSTKEPTRDGYTFLGWAYDADAAEPDFHPGDEYTGNESVTLYAVWANDNLASGECGENVSWFLAKDGTLTVTGSGAMDDYIYYNYNAPWKDYRGQISKVIIGGNISHIGDAAFYDCDNLRELSLKNSCTLGHLSFGLCDNLTKVLWEGNGYLSSSSWDSTPFAASPVTIYVNVDSLTDDVVASMGGAGLSEVNWRVFNENGLIDDYGVCLKLFIESCKSDSTTYLVIKENASIDGDLNIPKNVLLTVNEDVSLEVHGDVIVNETINIYGSITALNMSILNPAVISFHGDDAALSVENELYIESEYSIIFTEGHISVKDLRLFGHGDIYVCGGSLTVTNSCSIEHYYGDNLIWVDPSYYSKLSDAVNELLYPYICYGNDYYEKVMVADEALMRELISLPLGKIYMELSNDITLCSNLAIGENAYVIIPGGIELTVAAGINLTNSGEVNLGGIITVSDSAGFVNNGIIGISTGYIDAAPSAKISHSSTAETYMYLAPDYIYYTPPEAKHIPALINCGLNYLPFEYCDYTIDADWVLPSDVFMELYHASVTLDHGVSLTIKGSDNSMYLSGESTFIIDGKYDGPEILVYYDSQVLPEDKIISRKNYGDTTAVKIGMPKATSLSLTNESDEVIPSGSTEVVDMAESPTRSLGVVVAPEYASSQVTWKSSSTALATVSTDGLVTFLKPGVVTITATAADGSGKSANVKFDVSYMGYAANVKFTGKLSDMSTGFGGKGYPTPTKNGLQEGDSVQLQLFGADKINPISDLSVFEFSVAKGGEFVKVDASGLITAKAKGGTGAVVAKLKGDPLNRSFNFTIKTIAQGINKVNILPANPDDVNFSYVTESDAYMLSQTMEAKKGGSILSYQLRPQAFGSSGDELTELTGRFTWASSNSSIATVVEDKYGNVTLSIKPGVEGNCTITATAKDTIKAQGILYISVKDFAPRLEAATATLDAQKGSSAILSISESYYNSINSVEFIGTGVDGDSIKAKFVSDDKVKDDNGNIIGHMEYVELSATRFVKNQTIKGQLMVHTDLRVYPLPLNINIKNTVPAVTVKQTGKVNLFNTNSTAEISVTAKNETVENVVLKSTDFAGTWVDGKLIVSCNTASAKPNTKATLLVKLAGYEYPVEKAVTIGTETKKPALAAETPSATINLAYGSESLYLRIKNNTEKNMLPVEGVSLTFSPDVVKYRVVDPYTFELYDISPDFMAKNGGKINISVMRGDWNSHIVLPYTVKVNTSNLTLKPKASSLSLNVTFPGIPATTEAVFNQANIQGSYIRYAELEPVKETSETGKLSVRFENGQFVAEILDKSVKPGSYAYSFIPVCDESGKTLAAVKLSVRVVNTQPKVTLSANTISLNAVHAGKETGSISLNCTTAGYKVVDGHVMPTDTKQDLIDSAALLDVYCVEADDKIQVVANIPGAAPKAGSYKFAVTPIVKDEATEETEALKPVNLTVKVYRNDKYSVAVSASGKLDAVVRETSAITYAVTKLTNVSGNVVGVDISGQDAEMFQVSMGTPNAKKQATAVLKLKSDESYSTSKSYKLQLDFLLDNGITVSSSVLTVKVSSSAIKLVGSPKVVNVYQSQSRSRIVYYDLRVTSPVGAKIDSVQLGKLNAAQQAFKDVCNVYTDVADDGMSARVKLVIRDVGALGVNKTYTLPLEIWAEGQLTTTPAKLSMSVKVLK